MASSCKERPHGIGLVDLTLWDRPNLELIDVLRELGPDEVIGRTWIVFPYWINPMGEGLGLIGGADAALASELTDCNAHGGGGWVAYEGRTLLRLAAETSQVIHAIVIRLRPGCAPSPPPDWPDPSPWLEEFQHPDADLELRFDEESAKLTLLWSDPSVESHANILAAGPRRGDSQDKGGD